MPARGPGPPVTQDEFEREWSAGSGRTIEEVRAEGFSAERCPPDCGYEGCQGWRMVHDVEREARRVIEAMQAELQAFQHRVSHAMRLPALRAAADDIAADLGPLALIALDVAQLSAKFHSEETHPSSRRDE
jgi:hypothetical protein